MVNEKDNAGYSMEKLFIAGICREDLEKERKELLENRDDSLYKFSVMGKKSGTE